MSENLDFNLRHAEKEASMIIEKYGINSPDHIRLNDIAYDLGANVIEGKLNRASASLIRVDKKATIRVSMNDSCERKRFSIAHELGHFVLNHSNSIQRLCNEEDMMDWYNKTQETEANFFAGELILPKSMMEKRCVVREANFEPIKRIANDFRASLTATAIRFVRFCPEMCAMVFSRDGKIIWFYKSKEWWPFINKNQSLDKRTIAFDFFVGKTIPDEPIEIEADAWVDTHKLERIVEHSIGVNGLLKVSHFRS